MAHNRSQGQHGVPYTRRGGCAPGWPLAITWLWAGMAECGPSLTSLRTLRRCSGRHVQGR
jgi:hypothetical protein